MSRTRRLLPLLPLLAVAALVALLAWPAFAQSDPTRPSNLTAEIVDDGVALSWNAPTDDVGSVDGYQVLRRKPGEDAKGVFHVIADDTGDTQTQEQIDSTREHIDILRRDGWDDVNVRRVERSYSTAYDGAMSPNSFTWDGLTHDIATLAVTSEDELWLRLHVGKGSGRICAAPDGCFVPYRYKLVVDGKEFHSRDAETSRIDHFSIRGRCELAGGSTEIKLGGYGVYEDCAVWVAGPYEYRGWDADGLSLTAGDSVTVKILGLPTPEVRGMSLTGGQGASRTVRALVFTPQNAKLYVRYREFAPYTKDWVELTPINLGSGTTSQNINLTGLQPGITYQVQASFASNFDLPEPIRAREFIKFETG